MAGERENLILQEVVARREERKHVGEKVKAIRAELFDKQLAVIDDPAREIATLCTRRAGKTSLWSRVGVIGAITHPRAIVRIWAINRLRAKQLLWDELKLLCARHKIQVKPNETELTLRFMNGSEIRLLGADKDKEVQKKRGDKTIIEIVLESQGFGGYLKSLVEDVAGPCLFDMKGKFYLEGTPGPVCTGYWYEVTGRNDQAARWTSYGGKDSLGAGWSVHRWSVLDNPHLPHAAEELQAIKQKRRWNDDNPTFLREWCARWVNDFSALFYRFDEKRNLYNTEKIQPWGPGWMHTLGWDLGFRDDMALVVWGFHNDHPDMYEAFSWKKPGALSGEVVDQIQILRDKKFNFYKMVADTGGGGKMYVEDVMKRHPTFAFETAKKTDKADHVRMFNDDMLGGFIKLRPGSPLMLEMCELPVDPDWALEDNPQVKPSEDPRFANHCCDAGLYGWRASMHFLHREKPVQVKLKSPEWFRRQEDAMLASVRPKQDDRNWLARQDDLERDDFLDFD